LVRQDLPSVKPCWLSQNTSLSSMCLSIVAGGSSHDFPRHRGLLESSNLNKDAIYTFKCFLFMLPLLLHFFCFMIALAVLYSSAETRSTLRPVSFVK